MRRRWPSAVGGVRAPSVERNGTAAVVGRRWRWGGIAENGRDGYLLTNMVSDSLIKPSNLLPILDATVNTILSYSNTDYKLRCLNFILKVVN